MILQPRDNELLVSLKKFGVLSTPQILKLHFSNVAKTIALRRLRMLEASHFIRRAVSLDDGTNTWTVDYKGKTEMGLEERLQFSNRNTIKHDVLVNDIRMKLEQLGLGLTWTNGGATMARTRRRRATTEPGWRAAQKWSGKPPLQIHKEPKSLSLSFRI